MSWILSLSLLWELKQELTLVVKQTSSWPSTLSIVSMSRDLRTSAAGITPTQGMDAGSLALMLAHSLYTKDIKSRSLQLSLTLSALCLLER
jgi:hypothetical protein